MTLKSIGIWSAIKIGGALYALFGLLMGGFFALAGIAGFALEQGIEGADAIPGVGLIFGAGAIVFMPVFYGVMGAIGGFITALLYNLVAGLVGGIEVELTKK